MSTTQKEWVEQKQLGSGGFGIILLFTNRQGEQLAIKECKSSNLSEKAKERWKNECDIMRRMDNPYIVRCIDLPKDLEHYNKLPNPVLVMEFCSRGDLRKELILPQNMAGLEEHQVKAVLHDVSSAVRYLHKMKIYHRDLKPENIVLEKKFGTRIVHKVIDLGYAKVVDQNSVMTSFVGTIQYLAPELMSSASPKYTGTVDFWSLGTTIFECITGFRPFMHHSEMSQWLNVIKLKHDNHIYAYPSPHADGSKPILCEKLPINNRLSKITQSRFEKWLSLMLTYDPKARGGPINNEPGSYSCYNVLDYILKHRPLHVYDPIKNDSSFFDVVQNVSLSKVGQLMQMFRDIPREEIFLITTTGSVPSLDIPLENLCSIVDYDSEQEYDDLGIDLILVYQTPDLPCRTNPRGARLENMLSNKDKGQGYNDQLKTAKHLVHFCFTVYRNSQFLLKSTEALKLGLLRKQADIQNLIENLKTSLNCFKSKLEFYNQSYCFDLEMLEKKPLPMRESIVDKWNKRKNLIDQWNSMVLIAEDQIQKMIRMEKRIIECLKSPCTHNGDKENKMRSHFKAAQEIIDFLRGIPHSEQNGANKIPEIVRCLQSCESDWDQLSKEIRSPIRTILKLYKEATQIEISPEQLIKNIDLSCEEVSVLQRDRQQDIWDLISNPMSQVNYNPSPDAGESETQSLCAQSFKIIEQVKNLLSDQNKYVSMNDKLDWSFVD